jgi:uncharacterized iron-regulated membrane protein
MTTSTFERRPPQRGSVAWWRKWHRWIGFPFAVFLCWAGVTGTLVAFTEFFGADEALREQLRTMESPVHAAAGDTIASNALARALASVAQQAPGAPIDKITLQLKVPAPTVAVFTGKRGGGEDRQFVLDARTGAVRSVEAYADKPFLYRLHSGEAFGDGGLVFAMVWGVALLVLTVTGVWLWWRLRRKDAVGWRKVFY